ncbi:Cysteine-rich receptor-like protein kinase 15 [Platanthera zijinensis]|uniref:Cysteine-rich receptor-like protein kinase 15 n=1 Tax=Platanthera zijinensis TaxID=2320716 RepID=A0AAP0BK71_9ASPA
MPPLFHRLSVTILSLQVILIFFAAKNCSLYDPVLLICSNNTYTSSSSYGASIHRLLAQLIATVPDSPYLFLNGSAKTSTHPSNVYALAQCRPDYPPDVCSSCLIKSAAVTTASPDNGGCGGSISAALRLDECLLIYSDDPHFDFPESWGTTVAFAGQSSNSLEAAHLLKALLTQNALDASTASLRFAVNAGYIAGLNVNEIYVMAWCRLDQFAGNCSDCLQIAIQSLLLNMSGGQVIEQSCIVRFERFPFFGTTLNLSSPSPKGVLASEGEVSVSLGEGKGSKTYRTLFISILVTAVFILVCILFIVIRSSGKKIIIFHIKEDENKEQISIDKCLYHEFGDIRAATSDFSEENKLGEGGFGSVYRGVLRDGQEIAVKRLSKTSVQGVEELKNEVAFVAKLQHRNLVRLVGCCLEKEKLLLYEYLPNKSLDKFLFDPERRAQIDWGTRYKIIEGVAQGLLYLHEDSRLRVIHCDLKASNVLLDDNMNPKISDFGSAKLFGLNDVQRKTSRIAGTLGYMAPEYTMHGLFSTKSDVYSYGVLVLEMITGRRGVNVDESADSLDLQSYVGENWKEGNKLRVVDPSLGDRFYPDQMLRCIQIGLLCIQEDPAQRPSMASLVVMLSTGDVLLPEPLLPAFLR